MGRHIANLPRVQQPRSRGHRTLRQPNAASSATRLPRGAALIENNRVDPVLEDGQRHSAAEQYDVVEAPDVEAVAERALSFREAVGSRPCRSCIHTPARASRRNARPPARTVQRDRRSSRAAPQSPGCASIAWRGCRCRPRDGRSAAAPRGRSQPARRARHRARPSLRQAARHSAQPSI